MPTLPPSPTLSSVPPSPPSPSHATGTSATAATAAPHPLPLRDTVSRPSLFASILSRRTNRPCMTATIVLSPLCFSRLSFLPSTDEPPCLPANEFQIQKPIPLTKHRKYLKKYLVTAACSSFRYRAGFLPKLANAKSRDDYPFLLLSPCFASGTSLPHRPRSSVMNH